jgi:glycosyltransferase involved in cell wall biosynthesis
MDNGIYVVIATAGGPMENLFTSLGIKLFKIPIEGDYVSNKRKNGLLQLLKSIIDKEEINLVHCHLFASMQLASELYRMYEIPYIVTAHGLFYPNDVLYSTCIKASRVIAVSEPVRDSLNERLGNRISEKITVIPNGINAESIENTAANHKIEKDLNLPRNAKLLCYCSRLDWNKSEAARVLLFAFSKVLDSISNVHLVIIGDGLGRLSIQKEAQIINQMAGEEVVHVIGAKVNVLPYYIRSSIVIGTARVALEAMMCKRPVIAIGNKGYSGVVCEKNYLRQKQMYFGDHDSLGEPKVDRLVRDIKYLMHSSERRKNIGIWCRRWCEKEFNNDYLVNDIIKLYKKTLDSK